MIFWSPAGFVRMVAGSGYRTMSCCFEKARSRCSDGVRGSFATYFPQEGAIPSRRIIESIVRKLSGALRVHGEFFPLCDIFLPYDGSQWSLYWFVTFGCIFGEQVWLSQSGRNLFNGAQIRNLWGLVCRQTGPSTILDDSTPTFPFGAPECGGPSPFQGVSKMLKIMQK